MALPEATVVDATAACMRNYLILRDKARAFRADPEVAEALRAARAMQRACAAHGVPLAAAALQFSLRDPRVTATVVGVSEPSRIEEITTLMSEQIPAGLWAELDSLSVGPESWLN